MIIALAKSSTLSNLLPHMHLPQGRIYSEPYEACQSDRTIGREDNSLPVVEGEMVNSDSQKKKLPWWLFILYVAGVGTGIVLVWLFVTLLKWHIGGGT